MKIEEIVNKIYFLNCPKMEELASAVLRFQEYYDSPKFKGQVFTLDEFAAWYSSFNGGNFSYYSDWLGFNFPSEVFEPFYKGKFNPLSEQEKFILDSFRGKAEKFYVIGTADEIEANPSTAAIKHEIAHGLFYTNLEYRKEAQAELAKVDIGPITDALIKMNCGYNNDSYIMLDEAHAYIIDGPEYLKSEDVGLKPCDAEKYAEASIVLNGVFQRFYDKEKIVR